MPNGNGIKFPEFPSLFTKEDAERIQELERLAQEQQRAYRGLVPWKEKPAIERGLRRVVEAAYAPPKWLRGITPWEEKGVTPEQADIYIRETEEELFELKRRETVAERAPSIMDYITALAAEGLLTGEEAQLYELIPELSPSGDGLNLIEEERGWFLEYSKSLVGKSKEDIYEAYAQGGFPAPKSIAELVDLVKTIIPEPRQVLTTIALSTSHEDITAALQGMYAPNVEEGYVPALENINSELRDLGLEPTGDIQKDIKALEDARAERVKIEGVPSQVTTEAGEILNVNIRETDVLFEGELIAHYNPETKEVLPLSTEEEYEVGAVPPVGDAEAWLKRFFPYLLDDQAIAAFHACRGDEKAIADWWEEHISAHYGVEGANMNWVRKLAKMEAGTYEPPTGIIPELFSLYYTTEASWGAGWGDVIGVSGGVARWVGADGIADVLTKEGKRFQALAYPDTLGEFHWGMLANPRFWAQRGTRIVPFTLSLIPAAIAGYYLAAPIGLAVAGKLALGTWGTAILTAIFGGTGGAAIARPLESAMEAGAAYDKAKDMGASDEEAEAIANKVFVDNLKLAGLDAVQIAAMFAPVPGAPGASLIVKGLVTTARIGGRVVITGLTEAGEEAYQEVVTRQALGEEVAFDAEMKQVMALGGAMGLTMGVGGDVLSGMVNRTKEAMTPAQRKTFDRDVAEALAKAYNETQAEQEALDKFAATPEGEELIQDIVKVVKEQEYNKQTKEIIPEEVPAVPVTPEVTEPTVAPELKKYYDRGVADVANKHVRHFDIRNSEKGLRENMGDEAADAYKAGYEKAEAEALRVSKAKEVAIPKAPAVEVAKPPVGEKIHTEEIGFLEGQIIAVDKELVKFRKDYKTQTERLERTTLPYERTELQETIKNLEGILSELNIKKAGLQSKLEVLTGAVPEVEVIPERVAPEIQEEAWNKLPYPSKVALAGKAGIARTAASLPWGDLTRVQQELLSGTPITIAPPSVSVEGLSAQDLSEGKAVNKELAVEQTDNLVGLPERTLDAATLEPHREAARIIMDEQLYSADRSNPLSEAMVAAHYLGSIQEYVKFLNNLPKGEDGNIDWDAHIASRLEGAEFNDTKRWNLNFMPVLDAFAFLDKGRFGRPLRMSVYQIADQAQIAGMNYQGGWSRKVMDMEKEIGLERPSWIHFKRRGIFNKATATILENISFQDTLISTEELLQKEGIAEAVKGLTEEQQKVLVEYSKSMRLFFDETLAEMNEVRVALGRKPIKYLQNYLPWVYKTNVWGKLLGLHLKPDFLAEQAMAPDFIKPNAPWNPRALERKGGLADYTRVKDVRKLFLDYVGVASKEMFYTPAINNTKAAARYLRNERGLDVPASYLEDWTLREMVGIPNPLSRWVKESLPPQLINLATTIRARLNPAVLGLNPKWNMFIQTSSLALSVLHTGGVWTAKGFQVLWNPKADNWVKEHVPAYIIKERGRGSIIHQDLGTSLSEAQQISRSPLQTVDEWVTVITRLIENKLNAITAYAAKLKGESLGLKGAELVAYASDGAATTQSMYDPLHLPLAYSPFVRLAIPFQTFSFDALTRIREMSGIKFLRAGAYETVAADSAEGQGLIKNRARHFLEFMATIWVINMIGEMFNDRKPWEWSSFMPAANVMMMGADPNNSWNLPAPVRYVNDLWNGFEAVVEYGNWKPLAYWTLKWHAPAGAQVKKMLEGTIAVIDGGQKDVSGEIMFEFEDDPMEYIKAVTLGIWTTDAGKEYIDTHFEDQPVTTQRIIKDLKKNEEQLGTSVEGKWYTLRDYGTEALAAIRSNGVPDSQVLSDVPIYPLLAQFRLYCETAWEDYYKLPEEHHLEYRRGKPYTDATLYFWEKVSSLRSEEAKDMLESFFNEFVEENPRAHWRGLPEIPEEMKLLPE